MTGCIHIFEINLKDNIHQKEITQLSKEKMNEVIENQAGRLDEVLATFIDNKEVDKLNIPTGFPDLDKLMGGLRLGELVVVGARPSIGKTSFLLSLAKNISFRQESSAVLYINLESTLRQTAERLTFMLKKKDRPIEAPFYISAPTKSIEAILDEINVYIKDKGVKVVFIDYIQMLQIPDDNQRNRSLTTAISALKQLSREQHVSVILSSQLNRSLELRSGYSKQPYLSDLRDSGALEQESDKVIFLNRLECYGITEDENGDSTKSIVKVILAKNRTGFSGEVSLKFAQESVSFESLPTSENNWGELNTDLVF